VLKAIRHMPAKHFEPLRAEPNNPANYPQISLTTGKNK